MLDTQLLRTAARSVRSLSAVALCRAGGKAELELGEGTLAMEYKGKKGREARRLKFDSKCDGYCVG